MEDWIKELSFEGEEWKWIEGYEGMYRISTHGRVLSVVRGRRILKLHVLPSGYVVVNFSGKKNYAIHRLVAMAFIPNPDNKAEVDHLDNVKGNNHVDNLEWVTRSQNVTRQHRRKWAHIL